MDLKAYHRDFVIEHTDVAAWQSNAENADRAIVSDLLGYGLAAGLTLTEQSSPNLTLQLAAGVAYDALGRRINVPANVTVNLGTDTDGNTTGVASGQERFVAVYLRFKRTAEDPSTAPDATTVYTTQRETYEVLRAAGASAPVSTATYPATPSGNPVLLGRVKITLPCFGHAVSQAVRDRRATLSGAAPRDAALLLRRAPHGEPSTACDRGLHGQRVQPTRKQHSGGVQVGVVEVTARNAQEDVLLAA